MITQKSFDVRQAARHTGLSLYMVGYLCREGIVKPTKRKKRSRGSERRFRFADLVLLLVIKNLLSKGISVKRIKHNINTLSLDKDGMFPERYIATNGEWITCISSKLKIDSYFSSNKTDFLMIVDTKKYIGDIANRLDGFEEESKI